MRCLVNPVAKNLLYIGNMSQLKKFAKKTRQSNLLQSEIILAQTNLGVPDNFLLKMVKHCPTR